MGGLFYSGSREGVSSANDNPLPRGETRSFIGVEEVKREEGGGGKVPSFLTSLNMTTKESGKGIWGGNSEQKLIMLLASRRNKMWGETASRGQNRLPAEAASGG